MAILKSTPRRTPGAHTPIYPDDLLGERRGDRFTFCANGLLFVARIGEPAYDIHHDDAVTTHPTDTPLDTHEAFSDAIWAHANARYLDSHQPSKE